MKKNIFKLLILLLCINNNANAQSNWVQKSSFQGASRSGTVSMTINNKGYLGTGISNGTLRNDFWEYNPQTDQWILRNPVPGSARWFASSFVIGSKGYVGGGDVGGPGANSYTNDFYEYNPATNQWTIKQNIGDHGRSGSLGFSINNKGYIAWGVDEEVVWGPSEGDRTVWEYNPSLGTGGEWVPKSDIPSNLQVNKITDITVQTANNEAFLSGGYVFSETWKYTPSSDSWSKISDNNFTPLSAFTENGNKYMLGIPSCNNCPTTLYKFNSNSSTWLSVDSNVPSSLGSNASAFTFTPCDYLTIVGNSTSRTLYSTNGNNANGISGSSTVCTSGNLFTISGMPSGLSISWTKSSNLTYVSGQNTNSYTVKAASFYTSGSGWVEATISGACGNVTLPRKNVWVGRPPSIGGTLTGPSSTYAGQLITYTHSGGTSEGTYDWTLPYNVKRCTSCWSVFTGGDGSNQIRALAGSNSGYVQVRKTNICGNGGAQIKYVTVSSGGGGGPIELRISPNPTPNTELNVSFYSRETGLPLEAKEFNNEIGYIIRNMNGEIKHNSKSRKKAKKINIRHLKSNKQYILSVDFGDGNFEQANFRVE